MADAIVKGVYIVAWFVGAGLVSSVVLYAGVKCDRTSEAVKQFFNLQG